MTKARKEHKCVLCHQVIPAGTEYVYRRVAPWECGEGDPMWYTYAAHKECDAIWHRVGEEFEWFLPMSHGEWLEAVDLDNWRKAQQNGATAAAATQPNALTPA